MIFDEKEIKALEARCTKLETGLADLKKFVQSVTAEHNKYADEVDGHKKDIAEAEKTSRSFFGDFNKSLDKVDATLKDMEKRLQRVEGAVAQIQKKIK